MTTTTPHRKVMTMKTVLLLALMVGCADETNFPPAPSDPQPDASVDAPAPPDALPVSRSCTNALPVLYQGVETLPINFDCGDFAAGHALVRLVEPTAGAVRPLTWELVCGWNTLTFPSDKEYLAQEIIGQTFDVTCN